MAELKNAGDPTSEEFRKGPEIGEQPLRANRASRPGANLHYRDCGQGSHIYGRPLPANQRKESFGVKASLQFQACDAHECYFPEQIDLELPLDCIGNVPS